MHLKLGNEFEEFIQGQVASGMYGNATEVIRDALRHMKESQEERQLQSMRTLLAVGEDEIAKGKTVPYSADLVDRLAKEALKNSKKGKPVKNEIKPRAR